MADHEGSLTDRFRGWIGLDQLDASRLAFLRKLERAEEDVALLRLVVVLVNGIAFLSHAAIGGPSSRVAIAVLALAFVYATGVVLLQARPAFGNVSWSLVTVGLDAVAISAWLAATGGWASPYFPLWYASAAAVGYRYNLPIVTGVSSAYVGAYAALCLFTGGVGSWIEFGLRAAYIPLVGAIVGFSSEGYAAVEHEHRDARRRLQDAIRTMDRGFAAVLEQAPDRILITNAQGTVEYANGPTAELGFGPGEGSAQARGVHRGAIETAIETGDRVDYVAAPQGVAAAGSFWCRASAITRDGEAIGAVVIARAAPEGEPREEAGHGEQRPSSDRPQGSSREPDPR